jgi:hypothetical protein
MVRTESSNGGLQKFNKQLHLEPHPAPVKIRRLAFIPIPQPNWLIIP